MKRYLLLVISAVLLLSQEAFTQHSGPVSQSACLGETAEFAVEHSFDYVTFSWEESIDNISFSPVAGDGYSGISSNVLLANTGALNPPSSGFWRHYRCRMYSNLYGWTYSDTASLEINFPPAVDFVWTNPCQGQTVHFIPTVTSGQPPYKYLWDFNDAQGGISVYPDPFYFYTEEGIYNVTLVVTDANGCTQTVVKQVEIFSIPALTITGKDVVCSNELGVVYSVDLDGENVHYSWDVSGFGTIGDNTLREISIDWNAVNSPTQTKILLTVTIDPSGCSTQVSDEVLITTYVAPPEGTVFRKPYESTLLIYKGPEVNSYKWGYTNTAGVDFYIPADKGGERFYCDFMTLDPANDYWVETSYDSRINCVTRSYFDFATNKIDQAGMNEYFSIYPVPAQNQLTVRFNESASPTGIAIYNLMMQKVYEASAVDASQDEYKISLEGFKSGIYLIRIADDSNMDNYRVFTIEK
jgi:PKD repeat protein